MAAAKDGFPRAYLSFILYGCGGFLLACSLVGLQLGCLNNDQDSFVESYCFSDSNSRAMVSAIFTVIVWLMGVGFVTAVCSFRTAKLSTGIGEGVYVALGSMDLKYCWRSLRTRWWAIMLLLLLLSYGPGGLQALFSALIQTVPVYVALSSSTAVVFDHTSNYNATDASLPVSLLTAFSLFPLFGNIATSATSVLQLQPSLSVTTTLIRHNFIAMANISNPDPSNAIRHTETIATITTSCSAEQVLTGLLIDHVNSSNFIVLGPEFPSGPLVEAYIYGLEFTLASSDHLVFYSSYMDCVYCALAEQDDSPPEQGSTRACITDLYLSTDEMIYTLGTRNIQKLSSVSTTSNTTVNEAVFGQMVVNASTSFEAASATSSTNMEYNLALATMWTNFDMGLFGEEVPNFMHSRICAAAAFSLNFLWANYGNDVNDDGTVTIGNDYTLYDTSKPVYHVVQQAYMSTQVSVAFAACLSLYFFLLCSIGAFFTARAHINVKSVRENSFFSCIDEACVADMVAAGASNCEAAQLDLAFGPDRVMYCTEEMVMLSGNSAPIHRIKIGFSPRPVGQPPSKSTIYH